MHVNTYIVLKFPLLYENMMLQYLYIYILERLGHMHENKTFLFLFLFYFFDDLTKTKYFNTGLVSLQYKNTSNIDQNAVTYLRKITDFLK